MPKKAKDYSKGKIYIIRNTENDMVYVGSTSQRLCERMAKHRNDGKGRLSHLPLYQAFNELGVQHFYIELIENYPCENIEQLLRKEGEWIRQYNSFENGYNGSVAGRNIKQWREQNKNVLLQKRKNYYEQNKDKIIQQKKEYNEQNKDKITQYMKEWRNQNKDVIVEKRKEHYQENKDKITKQTKIYREQNKDKIAEKRAEKVKCACGCEVAKYNLSRHNKSQKHQEWQQNQPSTSS